MQNFSSVPMMNLQPEFGFGDLESEHARARWKKQRRQMLEQLSARAGADPDTVEAALSMPEPEQPPRPKPDPGQESLRQMSEDGITAWHDQWRAGIKQLREILSLPIDREVEVWLVDGVCLKGRLQPKDPVLFVDKASAARFELRIGRTTFRRDEIESCVRLD